MRTADHSPGREGSALPIVLVAVLLLGTCATVGLSMAMFRFRMVSRTVSWEQAASAAEGGMEIAVATWARAEAVGLSPPSSGSGALGEFQYGWRRVGSEIQSTSLVQQVTREVAVDGVNAGYWCKYAYFANNFNIPDADGNPSTPIWLITGDHIYGPTHCNSNIYVSGSPEFHGDVTYAGEIIERDGSINDPVYHEGPPRKVPPQPLDSINFAQLATNAIIASEGDLCFVGETDVTVDGEEVTVINNGQTNIYVIGDEDQNIIYVESGSIPELGGHREDVLVTNSIYIWVPAGAVTNVEDGYWDTPVTEGQGWMSYQRFQIDPAHPWWLNVTWDEVQRQKGNGSYKKTATTRFDVIPEQQFTDKIVGAHTNVYSRKRDNQKEKWVYEEYTVRYWNAAVTNIEYTGSNLVESYTTYWDSVWVVDTNWVEAIGNVNVEGVMSRGLTIIADRDIMVTGDLIYTNDADNGLPYTNEDSNVMCALISGGDVVVANPDPSEVEDRTIHASIIATGTQTGAGEGDPEGLDGRFVVEDYNQGNYKGTLNVYGGIIQNWRGPVGTFGGGGPRSGFTKDYRYDSRFSPSVGKRPPGCPLLGASFNFRSWSEGPGS